MNKPLDVMSISHFSVCFVIGYFSLFNFSQFMILAIAWEFAEFFFARTAFSYHFEKVYPIPRHLWDELLPNKLLDLIINILGFYTGTYLRYYTQFV